MSLTRQGRSAWMSTWLGERVSLCRRVANIRLVKMSVSASSISLSTEGTKKSRNTLSSVGDAKPVRMRASNRTSSERAYIIMGDNVIPACRKTCAYHQPRRGPFCAVTWSWPSVWWLGPFRRPFVYYLVFLSKKKRISNSKQSCVIQHLHLAAAG